jgi:hypothetical protein
MFDQACSYEIGILKSGFTADMPNAPFVAGGPHRAQTLLGSQLIEHGVHTIDELFKANPFGLAEKKSYTIYEIDPVNNQRTYAGQGTVLPKPQPLPKSEALNDTDDEEHAAPSRVIPLFEPEPRREDSVARAERQTISVLRDEIQTRDQAVERSQRITEQALLQTDRMLDEIHQTLDTMKEMMREKDETAKKLASTEAQVDAILKLREFEESIRKEREAEREQWRERERQLQKEAETKQQQQGLGDIAESLAPFAPIIELILQRILPPQNPYGEMPGMPPGMPPGMAPGMPHGMPPGGMPPGMRQRPMRMPPQGAPGGAPPNATPPGATRPASSDRAPGGRNGSDEAEVF